MHVDIFKAEVQKCQQFSFKLKIRAFMDGEMIRYMTKQA